MTTGEALIDALVILAAFLVLVLAIDPISRYIAGVLVRRAFGPVLREDSPAPADVDYAAGSAAIEGSARERCAEQRRNAWFADRVDEVAEARVRAEEAAARAKARRERYRGSAA